MSVATTVSLLLKPVAGCSAGGGSRGDCGARRGSRFEGCSSKKSPSRERVGADGDLDDLSMAFDLSGEGDSEEGDC